MIDFCNVQKSIIQFIYSTIEELFLFYDSRSKKRMNFVDMTTENNLEMAEEILEGFREIKQEFIDSAKFAKKVNFNIK